MSGDFSTQLPKPPELQPIRSTTSKIWHITSIVLTIGGLGLMGVGGWFFLQQQIEASKPPPARILEVSVEEIEAAAPDTPTAIVKPSPTVTAQSVVSDPPTATSPAAVIEEPSVAVEAPVEFDVAETEAEAAEAAVEETVSEENNANDFLSEAKLVEETKLAQETGQSSEVAAEAPLTLADNPLLVVEEQSDPPTEAEAAAEAADSPINGTGQPLTRIVAESIGLDAEVIEVGWQKVEQNGVETNVWTVADYAAGWHQNSKLPGQGNNIVLSAHHNIKGEVFRYTVDLEPGDIVTLFDAQKAYDYVVVDKFIVKDKGEPEAVRRANAKWIGPFNEERLTLVTCWPYNNNTHRLIVIAKPAGEAQAMEQ